MVARDTRALLATVRTATASYPSAWSRLMTTRCISSTRVLAAGRNSGRVFIGASMVGAVKGVVDDAPAGATREKLRDPPILAADRHVVAGEVIETERERVVDRPGRL